VLRLTATDIACERGGREIFSRLSLSVAAGELLAVTGPNGAGKSTLLRLLAALLRPSAGEIRLEPEDDLPRPQRVHYLGHLDGLKSGFTVAENLDFWRKLDDRPDRPAPEALEAVGLKELAETPAHYLSAGQRRRVAVARLLVTRRPVWLLDEPSAGLDAAAEGRLGAIVGEAQDRGTVVVAASHQSLPVAPTATLRLGSTS
jgi:heme exporter protein A